MVNNDRAKYNWYVLCVINYSSISSKVLNYQVHVWIEMSINDRINWVNLLFGVEREFSTANNKNFSNDREWTYLFILHNVKEIRFFASIKN